jgi:hypothetical protein
MSYTDRDKYGIYQNVSGAVSNSSASPGPGPALMGADTLIGDSVVNGAEEDLGDIKEIMLDMHTGQVAYAVLAFGGFLGIGEKLFAVPWSALHLDTLNHRFVLNVEKDRLQNAPGFNPDAWPDMSDVTWAQQIHTFYGTDMQQPGAPSMGPSVAMGGMVGGGQAGGTSAGSRMGSPGNLQSGSGSGSTSGASTGSSAATGSETGGDLGSLTGGTTGSLTGTSTPSTGSTGSKKDIGGS